MQIYFKSEIASLIGLTMSKLDWTLPTLCDSTFLALLNALPHLLHVHLVNLHRVDQLSALIMLWASKHFESLLRRAWGVLMTWQPKRLNTFSVTFWKPSPFLRNGIWRKSCCVAAPPCGKSPSHQVPTDHSFISAWERWGEKKIWKSNEHVW